ncbi:hypothetical protein ACFSWE_14590 [Leucobacter albus]|uniref:Antitoxin HicB n=1 Tax=Leucobacter albus TaxID=272210 RepID=A0ABW3TLA7_9MICO
MITNYDVVAYRDGKWWTFEIPALTSPSPNTPGHPIVAMGQARTVADIAEEARDVIALWAEVDESSVSVEVSYRLPPAVQRALDDAKGLDAAGRAALDEAAALRRDAVRQLRTVSGLSQADSAAVLGLSRQRVQQLEATTRQ